MIAILVLSLSFPVAAAAGDTSPGGMVPNIRQYAAAIHGIRLEIDAATRGHVASGGIGVAAEQLRKLGAVRLPNGETLTTSTPSLARALVAGDSTSARRAIDSLDAALRTNSTAAVSPTTLDSLDSILRDSRFHPERNPIQRLLDWLQSMARRFLGWLTALLQGANSGPAGGFGGLAIAAAFLAAVAVAAAVAARSAARRTVPRVQRFDEAGEPSTSPVARERAHGLAAAGDYRLALRYLVLATLLELQEHGILDLRPGLTNREYLAAVRSDPTFEGSMRGPLRDLVDVFDRTWYGHEPVDAAQYERYRRLAVDAVNAARRARVA